MGRDIRYAPGRDPDSPKDADPAEDPAVTRAGYETVQPPQRTAAAASVANPVGNTQVPPLDPLPSLAPGDPANFPIVPNSAGGFAGQNATAPSPLMPGMDQPIDSDTNGAANGTSLAPLAAQSEQEPYGFCKRFFRGYPTLILWFPKHLGPPRKPSPGYPITVEGWPLLEEDEPSERAGERSGGGGYEPPSAPRRAPPSPWSSPPFPVSEYQGYPLIGVPTSATEDPLLKALYLGPYGQELRDSRLEVHGWVTAGGNWSTASKSNLPTAYWIVPNTLQVDQAVVKLEREVDWVQEDHIDIGFRSVSLYGIDYRYTTAGGYFSQQLLYHNNLYGYDPVELYFEMYIPRVFEGMVIRCGRWIACPDIETQYAPDNYLASHSLLFTYDSYTQSGVMFSFQLNKYNMVQGAIHSGTDMAPWYPGATPTGFFGWRWVAEDNNNAFYTCLNNINNAKFRYFYADGHLSGHDNFNYVVSTWEHRFTDKIHTKTEAYYMWQINAVLGGTPSLGAPASFGGGGGLGKYLPGLSPTYGILNYTMFALSKRDYLTLRNEWWDDQRGERSGYATPYTSNTIGISHQFNDLMMIRPEIGYYHSWNVPAFDLGRSKNLLMYGFDFTIRF